MPSPAAPLDILADELRIDAADDYPRLERLWAQAIDYAETWTGLALWSRSITLWAEDWRDVVLPVSPVASVSAVQYVDDYDGVTKTLPGTSWYLDRSDGPLLRIRFTERYSSLPAVRPGTVQVSYVAGYDEIPPAIQRALHSLVASWYANPESSAPVELSEVPLSTRAILDEHRIRVGAFR
jgi:uncharacterized phiE125 gp8 family phage protein